jgi:hypothetical protein
MHSHMSGHCAGAVGRSEKGKRNAGGALDCFREAQNKPLHEVSHGLQSRASADTSVS